MIFPQKAVSVTILWFLYYSVISAQQTFTFTGNYQTYTATTASVQITACGASGGSFIRQSGSQIAGGLGGCITGVISTTIGATYYVYVGGVGGGETANTLRSVSGGYNGGGTGFYGGGGGGSSDVRTTVGSISSR